MRGRTVPPRTDAPPGGLYGLYEGVPLTRREAYGAFAMPDRITIFRRTIR